MVPLIDDPLGLYEKIWTCMVCNVDRLFDDISVVHRPVAGLEDRFPGAHANVAYCNDRSTCMAAAHRIPVCPPAAVVLQAGDRVRLTAAALADRTWETDDGLSGTAAWILTLLRDEAASLADLAGRHPNPPELIFDTVRDLVQRGIVEVVT